MHYSLEAILRECSGGSPCECIKHHDQLTIGQEVGVVPKDVSDSILKKFNPNIIFRPPAQSTYLSSIKNHLSYYLYILP